MKVLFALAAILFIAVPAVFSRAGNVILSPTAVASDGELKSLPAIALKDLEGKQIAFDEFKDKVFVLDFWATWCGPCLAEVPFLNGLQARYGDRGLKVIGVTLTSGEAKEVKPFITRYKMKYTILMGEDEQTYALNIMGFPTTFLVTKDRKIYKKYIGAGPAKSRQLESDIEELLAGEKQ